jgi:hypothetical protein
MQELWIALDRECVVAQGTEKGEEKPVKPLVILLSVVLAVLLGANFVALSCNDHSQSQGQPSTTPIEPSRSSQGNPPSVPPSGPNPQ